MLALALAAILLLWAAVLLAFAGPLAARWREPVLRHPVLVIESDDWGAGPLAQADALARLSTLLQHIRDHSGRPAVMTLGLILEVPDGPRIAATHCAEYHALPLADPRFDAVRAAIQSGIRAGVFAPQLHGQCHYWPPALLAAARDTPAVRDWLTAPEPASTEDLPSPLQSRWVDASSLPSRALTPAAIQQAIATEAADYQALFGSAPQVAVATTFVWNDAVEAAWAQAGIEAIITPGRRATCRNAAGQPGCVDATMLAGERSLAGPSFLVRDVYFEPALGHAPQRLADGLRARTRQGRACLVETHRFNFLQAPDASLTALEAGLREALASCPDLRFAAPLELAHAMRNHDPAWVEIRLKPRLAAWRARLDEIPRFRRLSQLSGLALPLALLGGRA
ncbi:hypothetical protein [Thiobacillus denitrificans]|uniref:Uncharacterized protein n=1 Tax=Thiobacillus denitrificans TaxID=36861 RepID=A0A106BR00_THIDE|nr:hypothetical protein [Thiobacillus denitrificans]KVW97029.1 hypothetical protein ABW22_06370 [Thiobacillus denitrificans]